MTHPKPIGPGLYGVKIYLNALSFALPYNGLFCGVLQKFAEFASQARPFLFRSAYLIQYAIGADAEIERVWLARLTCLSDKSKKAQVGKISALKTMFKMVQKTLKQ